MTFAGAQRVGIVGDVGECPKNVEDFSCVVIDHSIAGLRSTYKGEDAKRIH